ncbi:SDR family oxidoreductase [Cellulomonas palmilytica]|uniref:SDR family oxidoreductase n=1 Tax=Cellulomonas palmilytica TaxID=2608402 RepID=UPI001F22B509|nr:SDR family oxidoreductase [Cellulomonas palmilytica]UJP41286.1 SDR family oxidoreductase [Cellulomonas palmilytica]
MTQGTRGVALVTGAAGGIGSAVVGVLRARGYTVVGTDRTAHDDVRALDITDGDAVAAFVARLESEDGPVEVLVNAAGLLRTGPALDDDDDLVALVAVNVLGTATVTRAVVRRMVERGRGSVVTVASNAARVPRTGMAAYGASKAALTAWTKSLGLEVAEHGVRCNVVHPGTTRTRMLDGLGDTEQVVAAAINGTPEAYKVGIPLRRVAEPDDVAAAVAFLASDDARHLTMHELYVDGGASLR